MSPLLLIFQCHVQDPQSLFQGPEDIQPGMLVHSGSSSIQETEAGSSEFEASMLCVARSCLKKINKKISSLSLVCFHSFLVGNACFFDSRPFKFTETCADWCLLIQRLLHVHCRLCILLCLGSALQMTLGSSLALVLTSASLLHLFAALLLSHFLELAVDISGCYLSLLQFHLSAFLCLGL